MWASEIHSYAISQWLPEISITKNAFESNDLDF